MGELIQLLGRANDGLSPYDEAVARRAYEPERGCEFPHLRPLVTKHRSPLSVTMSGLQALAPSLRAYVLAHGGAGAMFGLLAGMALLNVGLVGALWRAH